MLRQPVRHVVSSLSPVGGLWGLVKFLDLVDLKKHFDDVYVAPSRETKLCDYVMILETVIDTAPHVLWPKSS